MTARRLARMAAVAAIYVAATLLLTPISYGAVQFRLSELLVLLCFFNRDFAPALVVGCAIANAFSPLGLYDVFFGTASTALAVLGIVRCKKLWIATLLPPLTCVLVGIELHLAFHVPLAATCALVMAEELVVTTCVGYPLFRFLGKQPRFLKLVHSD